jgi:EAL and modified HD-GYP domain-containing signal transduction protein
VIALERARVCELVAERFQAPNRAQFYTAGLLSALDVLLDRSLDEALEPLPLAGDIRAALLGHEGPIGVVLAAALAYQRGDWDAVTSTGIDPGVLRDAYWRAAPYAEELRQAMAGAAAA